MEARPKRVGGALLNRSKAPRGILGGALSSAAVSPRPWCGMAVTQSATALQPLTATTRLAKRGALLVTAAANANMTGKIAKTCTRYFGVRFRDVVEAGDQRAAIKVALMVSAAGARAERCFRSIGEQRHLHPYPAA